MLGAYYLLTGVGIGILLTLAVLATWRTLAMAPRYPALPTATARKIERARRRNRADLRLVLARGADRPAREVGVRVRARAREEHQRLGEPPWFDPSGEERTR